MITSLPGPGPVTGARGARRDRRRRSRFQDAKGLEACAGPHPIARASGKTPALTCRRVKNNRLADAGYRWTLAASPGARGHYDRA